MAGVAVTAGKARLHIQPTYYHDEYCRRSRMKSKNGYHEEKIHELQVRDIIMFKRSDMIPRQPQEEKGTIKKKEW